MTPEYDPVRTEDSEDDARSLSCDVDDECMGTEMRAFFPDSSHLPDAMLVISFGLLGSGSDTFLPGRRHVGAKQKY